VKSDDPAVEVARLFAIALKNATDASSVRSVADAAGLNHATLLAIIKGRVWPDMLTIAKLENALEVDLWPGRP
jgi:transcriptional regulator with XRE-family HTH domain